jgi:hypothetical protein
VQRGRRLRLLLIVVPAIAVGAAVTWRISRPGGRPQQREPAVGRAAAARAAPHPMRYVRARSDAESSANLEELIAAYDAWVSRADALEARRAIIKTLLGHPSLQVRLEALLRAVDADQTPREADPLWRDLVRAVAAGWDADNFKYGRDLVQIETRPKPRDLVLESLAALQVERLAPAQRPLLASDFIDLYASLKPDQKPAVDRALHALAGSDVVEILAGRGLREGGQLEVAAQRQRALDEARRHPVQEAPAEP